MDLFKKSIWQEKKGKVWSFYCPLCQSARRLPLRPRPAPRHFAQVGLTSVVLTLATWDFFEWKGVISFIPLWTIFEIALRLRVRAAVRCDLCGFDPYLFLNDVGKARKEIEDHWRAKFAEKGIPFPEKKAALTGITTES